MTFLEQLYEEIESLTEQLKGLKPDSKEYEVVVNRVDKLMAKAIEIEKTNNEQALKQQQIDNEKADKEQQLKEERISRIAGWVIAGVTIAAPLIFKERWAKKSLKFEETGTVTTTVGREVFNSIFRGK